MYIWHWGEEPNLSKYSDKRSQRARFPEINHVSIVAMKRAAFGT